MYFVDYHITIMIHILIVTTHLLAVFADSQQSFPVETKTLYVSLRMLLWYNTAWAVLLIMYTIYNYIQTHSITDYNTLLYHGLLSIEIFPIAVR